VTTEPDRSTAAATKVATGAAVHQAGATTAAAPNSAVASGPKIAAACAARATAATTKGPVAAVRGIVDAYLVEATTTAATTRRKGIGAGPVQISARAAFWAAAGTACAA
jgi:hypothetical protein